MPDTEIADVVLVAGRRTEKRVFCANVLECVLSNQQAPVDVTSVGCLQK